MTYNVSISDFIDKINYSAINQTIAERMNYTNLSNFWHIKAPLEEQFGPAIYLIFYFVVFGSIMIKTRSFSAAAYVGILLGIILASVMPLEFKPYIFGMVVMLAAGILLSIILER